MKRSDRDKQSVSDGAVGGLVGTSLALDTVREQIRAAARFEEPVLIVGETGTGKELVARAVHRASRRGGLPLQLIHCAGLGADVLASELFGHRAGAFTGASRDRPGRLRAAQGSSVLLDEVTETPASFQASVLGTIERGEVQPVGSDTVDTVDVRFLATSNRPYGDIRRGLGMRLDLFHRLAAFVIEIPPLRQRPDDIAALAQHFLVRLAHTYGRVCAWSPEALELLGEHPYPGNVRELRQSVLRAFAATDGEVISAAAALAALVPGGSASVSGEVEAEVPSTLEAAVRSHIRRALTISGGNLSAAARMLDVPRSTLQHYLVKYRVELPDSGSATDRTAAG